MTNSEKDTPLNQSGISGIIMDEDHVVIVTGGKKIKIEPGQIMLSAQ